MFSRQRNGLPEELEYIGFDLPQKVLRISRRREGQNTSETKNDDVSDTNLPVEPDEGAYRGLVYEPTLVSRKSGAPAACCGTVEKATGGRLGP